MKQLVLRWLSGGRVPRCQVTSLLKREGQPGLAESRKCCMILAMFLCPEDSATLMACSHWPLLQCTYQPSAHWKAPGWNSHGGSPRPPTFHLSGDRGHCWCPECPSSV